jgi:hypothetical protein
MSQAISPKTGPWGGALMMWVCLGPARRMDERLIDWLFEQEIRIWLIFQMSPFVLGNC